MDKQLRTILAGAIKEEEHFRDFYKKTAQKTDIPSVKSLMTLLSAQEEEHRKKLARLLLGKIDVLPEMSGTLKTEENLLLTPVTEFPDLKKAISFAITAEKSAQSMYLGLSKKVAPGDAKSLFLTLAKEEKTHESLLIAERKKLGI